MIIIAAVVPLSSSDGSVSARRVARVRCAVTGRAPAAAATAVGVRAVSGVLQRDRADRGRSRWLVPVPWPLGVAVVVVAVPDPQLATLQVAGFWHTWFTWCMR